MSLFSTTYRPLLALALPLIFIQLCQASLGLIDTMIAGQYHYQDLAGVGLGTAMWSPVFVLLTGVMFVLVPKMSDFAALNNNEAMHRLFLQAKRMALWLAIAGFILVQLLAFIAPFVIDDTTVATITKHYLHFVAFAIPGLVYLLLYRFVSEGNSKLGPIIKMIGTLVIVNTLLNVVCVFGVKAFGVEKEGLNALQGLGGAGCGLATAISTYIAMFLMRHLVKQAVPVIQQIPVVTTDKTLTAEAGKLLGEGIPIGVAFVVEVLALTVLAFFASSLGVKQVAAHQIAINIAIVAFMIPFALSSATTIRIAGFPKAEDQLERKRTAHAAIVMSIIYGVVVALGLVFFGGMLLPAFSQDQGTLLIATGLLIYIGGFQLFDAIQIVAAGILRGLQNFVQPLLVVLVIYWLLVVPASYLLTSYSWGSFSGTVSTIWLVLNAGLVAAAVVLSFISVRKLSTK